MQRTSKRKFDELRPISFTRHFIKHAEGSVLVCFGHTKIICTASIEEGVPSFLKDSATGWVTGEYGMLPRSTTERMSREAIRGRQKSRTIEIQRLIGRSLRAAVDLTALEGYTIKIDCDVLQADAGTRTAAISGSCIALVDAIRSLQYQKKIIKDPLKHMVAGVSVGIYDGEALLDLDYAEDSKAHTDMNIVMTDNDAFIEIQGTAEGEALQPHQLNELLSLAKGGIRQIIALQKETLNKP